MGIVRYDNPHSAMRLLYDSALDSWQRVKDLDLRLQQAQEAITRDRIERERHEAVQQFRRAYTEQQVRLRAA